MKLQFAVLKRLLPNFERTAPNRSEWLQVNMYLYKLLPHVTHIVARFGRMYEADFVAKEAVKRVLRDQFVIYVPPHMSTLGAVKEL